MEDDSLSDNVTDAAQFSRMNVRAMQPELITEGHMKPEQLRRRHREQTFSCSLQLQPVLLIFLLTVLLP